MLLLFSIFSTLLASVAAQNFTIPSRWTVSLNHDSPLICARSSHLQNTSSFFSRAERISLAQRAIDKFKEFGYTDGTMKSAIVTSNGAQDRHDVVLLL
jgi:hypothetical protein